MSDRSTRDAHPEVHDLRASLDQARAEIERLRDELARTLAVADVLREGEARFRAIHESTPDGIITFDASGIIQGWNWAAETIFGYPAAEVLGQPLTVLVPPSDRATYEADWARFWSAGKNPLPDATTELTAVRKDGSEAPIEVSLGVWRGAAGQFFTAIVRDITERKLAERALRDRNRALEAMVALDHATAALDLQ